MLGFVLAYALAAALVRNSYYQLMLTLVLVWACFGLAWNVLSGYTGLVSFGHAAFFGLGAYTTALGQAHFGWTPYVLIPIAAVLGGISGLAIGLPTFRLRGHYFALAMLAYPLALLYVFEWLGYQEVSLPMMRENPVAYMQFADNRVYTFIALGMLLGAMLLTRWVERNRFGMALLSIKQNEAAAEAAGINTYAWKLKAITLSGAIAGAVGAFYAVVLLVVTPVSVFGMLVSAQALVVTMFGGVGTVWGAVIGSAILIPVAEILHSELGLEAARHPGRDLRRGGGDDHPRRARRPATGRCATSCTRGRPADAPVSVRRERLLPVKRRSAQSRFPTRSSSRCEACRRTSAASRRSTTSASRSARA